jgi:hypothetical protein
MAPRQLYQAKPFTEPPPQLTRKPPDPVDPSRFRVKSSTGREYIDTRAQAAAENSYRTEKAAYDQEKEKYDVNLDAWRQRKDKWDQTELAKENTDRQLADAPLKAKEDAQKIFDQSIAGQIAPYAKGAAYPAGAAAGVYEGLKLSKVPWVGVKNPANVGLVPRLGVAALLGGLSAKSIEMGALNRADAEDPNASPAEEASSKTWGNFLIGQGIGGLGGAGIGASPGLMARFEKDRAVPVAPDPEAVKAALEAANANPPQNLKGSGMLPKEAGEALVKEAGLTPGMNLKENRAILKRELPNAKPEIVDRILEMHPAFNKADLVGSIDKILRTPRKLALPLAIGTGAALGADSLSNSADAAPQGPEEGAPHYFARRAFPYARAALDLGAPELDPDTYPAMAGTGSAVADALKAAFRDKPSSLNLAPPPKKPRLNADIPPVTAEDEMPGLDPTGMPSPARIDRDRKVRMLDEARAEDARQRREAGMPGSETEMRASPRSALDETISRIRDALPDHERKMVDEGATAQEIAAHAAALAANARAGKEAMDRGEDFWGGTPEHERHRTALQTLFNAANIDAKAAGVTPTPVSQETETDPVSGFEKGGRVLRRADGGLTVVDKDPSNNIPTIMPYPLLSEELANSADWYKGPLDAGTKIFDDLSSGAWRNWKKQPRPESPPINRAGKGDKIAAEADGGAVSKALPREILKKYARPAH